MSQFHEGQEAEVFVEIPPAFRGDWRAKWRKARVVREAKSEPGKWVVEFVNGDRGVFDTDHIRATDMDFREDETQIFGVPSLGTSR